MPRGNPAFEKKFDYLSPELKAEIIQYAKDVNINAAANKYYEQAGMSLGGLKDRLTKIIKPTPKKREDGELTDADAQLLQKFADGNIGYDEIQRVMASRVFEKILRYPTDLKVRDWLQSEMIKMKKDETTRQKDALEKFINSLFAGFIPSTICPHCHKSTIVRTERLGELHHEILTTGPQED